MRSGLRSAQDIARSLIVDEQFWEYFKGWDAQNEGQPLPNDASELFKHGYGDSYAAGEMEANRG